MTDIAIQRIAQAIGSSQHSLASPLCYCGGDRGGGGGRGGGRGGGGGGCEWGGGRECGWGVGVGGGGGGGGGGVGGGGGGWHGMEREGRGRKEVGNAKGPQLKCLILSGCHLITDVGLRWVCLRLSGGCIVYITRSCPYRRTGFNYVV